MITLINSSSPFTEISPNAKLFVNQNAPTGLMYLSAYLKSNGIKVDKLIDLDLNKYSKNEFARFIKNCPSRYFGISVTTEGANNALRLCRMIKYLRQDSVTILGGPHITFCAKEIVQDNTSVDFCVMGEGEVTLYELIKTLEKNHDPSKVKGLVFNSKKLARVITTPKRELIKNLDMLPFPDRSIIDMSDYEECSIQTTRGCPGTCPFCAASSLFGGRVRFRSPENVVDEIEMCIKKYNAKSIMFSDDTFTVNKKRLFKILDLIERRQLYSDYFCEARIDTLDGNIIKAMAAIGCTRIQVGIESASETTRSLFNKSISSQHLDNISNHFKSYGIVPITNFVLGIPSETKRDIQNTLDFARILVDRYNYIVNFSLCTPLPGTDYYNHPSKYGIEIVEDNFDLYNLSTAVINTKYLDTFELNQYYLQSIAIANESIDKYMQSITVVGVA